MCARVCVPGVRAELAFESVSLVSILLDSGDERDGTVALATRQAPHITNALDGGGGGEREGLIRVEGEGIGRQTLLLTAAM